MAGLAVAVSSGYQHRGDGGFRLAVAIGGSVEQLGGAHLLRDHTQEAELDVTGSQDGAGGGVLEAGRGVVERVLGRQKRPGAALELLVVCSADPLGTNRPACACHCVHFYLKKGLRIQSAGRAA
jgi:hypothetical protein